MDCMKLNMSSSSESLPKIFSLVLTPALLLSLSLQKLQGDIRLAEGNEGQHLQIIREAENLVQGKKTELETLKDQVRLGLLTLAIHFVGINLCLTIMIPGSLHFFMWGFSCLATKTKACSDSSVKLLHCRFVLRSKSSCSWSSRWLKEQKSSMASRTAFPKGKVTSRKLFEMERLKHMKSFSK